MEYRRVVITGLGAISPVGNDVETMWNNIISDNSGIDYITKGDKDQFPVHVAAEVKTFDPRPYITRMDIRKMDAFTQYAVVEARITVNDPNLTIVDTNS